MKPFKVRSAERDHKTDKGRIAPILADIETALAGAQKELEALRGRISDATTFAAFAVGTGDDEYLDREPKDVRRISEYEQQIIAAENRLQQLERHIAILIELRDLSNARFSEFIK
jgi:hypothetical protein